MTSKKPVLITGGAGYIGSHAAKLFLEKGHKVVILDNLFRGYQGAIDVLKKYGDVDFHKIDLRNSEEVDALFDQYEFDSVLHFAALCLVSESMEKPEEYFKNNVYGSLNLFEAMRHHNVRNLVFSSTCAVYGESEYLPLDEKHPKNPTNSYGESKLIVEQMLKWYDRVHDFRHVTFRYFNVCGAAPDGTIGDSKRPSVLLVQNAVRGALGIEDFKLTCPKVETPDGTPIRDYVDVNDLVEAHFLAYEYLLNGGSSDALNLGSGNGISVLEIISQVENILGTKIEVNHGVARKGEYAKVYASYNRAKEKLGWNPKLSLKDSVNALVAWYRDHPRGYDA
ncbi:UDP-glucose 4-epimerase GalE [candidate division WWE3 bacterium]|jgi:UDP-glucose 4-epimerase|uniref:UDP-glucose 4-epimerase n=1 Tax=candidate division WWE3 bacterium TaxID=2053526 RepID=A0A3A4ZFR4_UNCKA|nr:MAG: UDP-glucose 4-epimerase GalE [candidate division WWE3 bacterium]